MVFGLPPGTWKGLGKERTHSSRTSHVQAVSSLRLFVFPQRVQHSQIVVRIDMFHARSLRNGTCLRKAKQTGILV